MLGQLVGPVPHGGGARAEVGPPAREQLLVRGVQILQQHPPGDAVDHEVVGGQEERRPLPVSVVEQPRGQQWTPGQVESGLRLRHRLVLGGPQLRRAEPRQVVLP